uniref:Cation:proton antiporter n=1 Tax=Ignisphaera aggregans TaxID=334771 RepID=A0A7C2Z8V6_9CREN
MTSLVLLGSLTPVIVILAFSIPVTKVFKAKRAPFVIAFIGVVYAAIASTFVFYEVYTSGRPLVYTYGGWPPHFGIDYEVDYFNALLGMFTAWTMLVIVIYSHWYGHHLDEPVWYYTLLLGLEAGMLGCLYTGDAFNLFVMLEVLGISAYGLVAYHKDKGEAVEAAAKYALIGAVATVLYFVAVVILYAGYGSVNMAVLALMAKQIAIAGSSIVYLTLFALALAVWVFTYKSAVFPNHFWLPDAHPEAPTPVSAALSGLVVNVGLYACARFLYTIFGRGSLATPYREAVLFTLFVLGTVSGIVGALMMMVQRDIKRLLAYSTISHMGIALMGLSAGFIGGAEAVALAIAGATIHIVAHGIAKALLFMASGVLIDAAGSRDLDEMRGIGRYYPLTSVALIMGFLSLGGFIPFIGFYSKLYIALGYLEAGFVLGPILIIVISAISLLGYFKAISALVFSVGGEPKQKVEKRWVEILLLAMALALLVLGIVINITWPVYASASAALAPDGVDTYIVGALEKNTWTISFLGGRP